MRRLFGIGAMLVGLAMFLHHNHRTTLYAQSVPATITFGWNANPASDNVTSYTATCGTGTPVVVPATACTAAGCSTPMTLTAFGAQTCSTFATNTNLSGGAGVSGSPQNGPTASFSFSLNQRPGAQTGQNVH